MDAEQGRGAEFAEAEEYGFLAGGWARGRGEAQDAEMGPASGQVGFRHQADGGGGEGGMGGQGFIIGP